MKKMLILGLVTLACLLSGVTAQSQIVKISIYPHYQVSGLKELNGDYILVDGQLKSLEYYISGDSLKWSLRYINTKTGYFGIMSQDSIVRFGLLVNFQGLQKQSHRGRFNNDNAEHFIEITQTQSPPKRIGTIYTEGVNKPLEWSIYANGNIEPIGFEGYFYMQKSMSIISYFLVDNKGNVIEDGHINIIDPITKTGNYETPEGKTFIKIKKYP